MKEDLRQTITNLRCEYIHNMMMLMTTKGILSEVKQFLVDVMDIVEQSTEEQIIIELYDKLKDYLNETENTGT